jgi:putative ABC transport system permease protein
MSSVLGDLRHAVRQLRAAPGFVLAAAVTLALAIGANTVIFSFVSPLLLRPLPLRDPEGLGWVFLINPDNGNARWPVSLPEYAAFRDGSPAFAQLAARQGRAVPVARGGEPAERVLANLVTGDLHGVWGARAHLGRTLGAADEAPGAPRVAVLSHRYWTRRFAAAPTVVGETWRIDGGDATIVGVLTPDMELGNIAEINLWLPLQQDPRLGARGDRTWRTTGRLVDGATIADASAQVEAIGQHLEREHPDTNRRWRARVGTTADALAAPNVYVVLSLLATAVGLLLLLACANVTNMLLARLSGRRQELAVRTALGATRGRLVQQLLVEGLLLGAVGGVLGLAIGWAGTRAISASAAEPFFEQVTIDARVAAFAVLLSLAAPLAFTVLPMLGVMGRDLRTPLGEQSRRSVGGRGRQRSGLVVAQLAMAVALLGAAGLVVRSMVASMEVPYGFERRGLLTWQVEVPADRYPTEAGVLALRERLVERLVALPGVSGAATVTTLPVLTFEATTPVWLDDRPPTGETPSAARSVVSPGYFELLGLAAVRGRTFTSADRADAPRAAVVSVATAQRFWGDAERAVGASLRVTRHGAAAPETVTVVGVVPDVANPDFRQAPAPHVYLSDTQGPVRQFAVAVRVADTGARADASAAALGAAARRVLSDIDADLAPYALRTFEAAVADETASDLVIMALFVAFGVVAILLAGTGMYGVMSYVVSQRAPEFAVRMALGATAGDVGRQVALQAARLVTLGVGLGLVGALALAQAMASLLFGVAPMDPVTHGSVALLAVVTVAVAVGAPVRRATRVDPMVSLRQA